VTIITGSVGPLESHGCPFKHFSQLNLTQHLNQLYQIDLKSDLMKDIIEFKKNDHYHLACTAVWEHQHKPLGVKKGDGLGQGESVSHPNRQVPFTNSLSRMMAVHHVYSSTKLIVQLFTDTTKPVTN
jgi:DNA primase large subunit